MSRLVDSDGGHKSRLEEIFWYEPFEYDPQSAPGNSLPIEEEDEVASNPSSPIPPRPTLPSLSLINGISPVSFVAGRDTALDISENLRDITFKASKQPRPVPHWDLDQRTDNHQECMLTRPLPPPTPMTLCSSPQGQIPMTTCAPRKVSPGSPCPVDTPVWRHTDGVPSKSEDVQVTGSQPLRQEPSARAPVDRSSQATRRQALIFSMPPKPSLRTIPSIPHSRILRANGRKLEIYVVSDDDKSTTMQCVRDHGAKVTPFRQAEILIFRSRNLEAYEQDAFLFIRRNQTPVLQNWLHDSIWAGRLLAFREYIVPCPRNTIEPRTRVPYLRQWGTAQPPPGQSVRYGSDERTRCTLVHSKSDNGLDYGCPPHNVLNGLRFYVVSDRGRREMEDCIKRHGGQLVYAAEAKYLVYRKLPYNKRGPSDISAAQEVVSYDWIQHCINSSRVVPPRGSRSTDDEPEARSWWRSGYKGSRPDQPVDRHAHSSRHTRVDVGDSADLDDDRGAWTGSHYHPPGATPPRRARCLEATTGSERSAERLPLLSHSAVQSVGRGDF